MAAPMLSLAPSISRAGIAKSAPSGADIYESTSAISPIGSASVISGTMNIFAIIEYVLNSPKNITVNGSVPSVAATVVATGASARGRRHIIGAYSMAIPATAAKERQKPAE